MTQGRHSLAPQTPRTPRTRRIALVAAPLATLAVVGIGVATSGSSTTSNPHLATSSLASVVRSQHSAGASDNRQDVVDQRTSRSYDRLQKPARAELRTAVLPVEKGKRWTTEDLDLRLIATDGSRSAGEIVAGKQIGITGRTRNGFSEIIQGKGTRWVHTEYLSKEKPDDPAQMGLADKPCAGTESTEDGLTDGAVRVYRSVCNNFPQITHYGGYDNHGEHSSGKAIDIMTDDSTVGYKIAEFLKAHASELNLYDIIYRQHIWTPERASEGWRSMPDRGSATANHYDHVHVSVN